MSSFVNDNDKIYFKEVWFKLISINDSMKYYVNTNYSTLSEEKLEEQSSFLEVFLC